MFVTHMIALTHTLLEYRGNCKCVEITCIKFSYNSPERTCYIHYYIDCLELGLHVLHTN